MREDAVCVEHRRAAGGVNHIRATDEKQRGVCSVPVAIAPEHQEADHLVIVHDQIDHAAFRDDRDALLLRLLLQRFDHGTRGIRAHGGGPLPRIMIGLVTYELAVLIAREWDADIAQVQEGPCRQRRLGKRVVTVHRTAGEQRAGHLAHRVRLRARQCQLVIGLLVRAGVTRGTRLGLVGHDDDIVLTEFDKPGGGTEASRTSSNNDRIGREDIEFEPLENLENMCFDIRHSLTSSNAGQLNTRKIPSWPSWRALSGMPWLSMATTRHTTSGDVLCILP